MARERRIKATFTDGRSYFENLLGRQFDFTAATGPYEYLLGALSGCLFSTFKDIAPKELTWKKSEIEVCGVKREDEEVQTLKKTSLHFVVSGCNDEKLYRKCVTKASELCSIFNTIKCVSEMEITYTFI